MINLNAIICKGYYYIRKEDNNYRIITSLGYDYSIIINENAKEILDMVDGRNSIKQVLQIMTNKYSQVEKEILFKDLISIIMKFYKANMISFIVPKGEKLKMKEDIIFYDKETGYKIEAFTELNFNDIIKFFNKQDITTILNEFNETTYNEITVRDMLFSFKEQFYGLFKKDKLSSIISYKARVSTIGDYYRNGLFMYDNTLDDFEIEKFLVETTNDLLNKKEYHCKNILFSFINKNENTVAHILEKRGFINILSKSRSNLVGDQTEFIYEIN